MITFGCCCPEGALRTFSRTLIALFEFGGKQLLYAYLTEAEANRKDKAVVWVNSRGNRLVRKRQVRTVSGVFVWEFEAAPSNHQIGPLDGGTRPLRICESEVVR